MKTGRIIAFIAMSLAIFPASFARAQNYDRIFRDLAEFNRVKPMQNPVYEPAEDILSRHVVDRKNKVVGEVRDIVLNENGNIATVAVEFDRLRLGAPVSLSYREMRIKPVGNTYTLGFEADEIQDIYPQLLANVETAAGEDENVFSVRKIIGAPVKDNSGRNLGRVQNVLFDKTGNRAQALYVSLSDGNLQGRPVAIPYGMAQFEDSISGKTVNLTREQADAMLRVAAQK